MTLLEFVKMLGTIMIRAIFDVVRPLSPIIGALALIGFVVEIVRHHSTSWELALSALALGAMAYLTRRPELRGYTMFPN